MKTKKSTLAVTMAVLMVFGAVSLTLAWPDMPPAKAFISGPGIEGQLQITDQTVLNVLQLGSTEDIKAGTIQKPSVLGNGFKIVRYFDGGGFHFGDLVYYPSTEGARSVVYFEDALNGNDGPSPLHKKWLYATANGDAVLKGYLKGIGATVSDAKTAPVISVDTAKVDVRPQVIAVEQPKVVEGAGHSASVVESTGASSMPLVLAAIGILGVVGVVGVVVMRRRAVSIE